MEKVVEKTVFVKDDGEAVGTGRAQTVIEIVGRENGHGQKYQNRHTSHTSRETDQPEALFFSVSLSLALIAAVPPFRPLIAAVFTFYPLITSVPLSSSAFLLWRKSVYQMSGEGQYQRKRQRGGQQSIRERDFVISQRASDFFQQCQIAGKYRFVA